MPKYVDIEKLGIGKCNPDVFEDKGYAKGWNSAIEIIENAPAADVRPVVRKPVIGYEGLYFVSNDGEVTNADGLAMKQHIKKGNGTCYKSVSLYKDGSYKTKYVHRLVAEAFIPNQNNLPIINHKDEDGNDDEVCPCVCKDGWYSWLPHDDFFCGYGKKKEGNE